MLWPQVSARQAYPLYYNLARPFVSAAAPADPARALNLFSAIWGAVAVGLAVYVSAAITGSLTGGAIAGGLLAFSYTFWTQAIIAEVYTLHLALIGLCLLLLGAYAAKPTLPRLTAFFIAYAVGFGNHFSMILLLVPFAVFLLQTIAQTREPVQDASGRGHARSDWYGSGPVSAEPDGGLDCLRRAGRLDESRGGILVRHHETGLARHDGPRYPGQPDLRSARDVVVRRAAAVRRRGTRARRRRHRRTVAEITPVGRADCHGAGDQRGICVHLQRRRHARVLPAGSLHDGVVCRRGDRMVHATAFVHPARNRGDRSAPLRRMARLVDVAGRRSTQ